MGLADTNTINTVNSILLFCHILPPPAHPGVNVYPKIADKITGHRVLRMRERINYGEKGKIIFSLIPIK